MPEFLHLKPKDQKQILDVYQESSSRFQNVVEKDIWVCWVLKHLFSMPEDKKRNMAFKGGTSLSKVYGVIDRFSEDVDITLDYRQFAAVKELNLQDGQTAPETKLGSGTRKRLDLALRSEVTLYITSVVAPYLRECLKEIPGGKDCLISVLPDGESLQHLMLDYNRMQAANMLYGEKIPFDSIVNTVKLTQDKINSLVLKSITQ